MSDFLHDLTAVCAVLLAAELVARLCPKNAAVQFVHALAVLALLLSGLFSFLSQDFDLSLPAVPQEAAAEDLTGYLEDCARSAGEAESERRLSGLLATVGLKAEKIELFIDIGEDGGIVLTKVRCLFRYRTEAERARTLLQNVLGEQVEVETDGA